jgi:hypothetical protein
MGTSLLLPPRTSPPLAAGPLMAPAPGWAQRPHRAPALCLFSNKASWLWLRCPAATVYQRSTGESGMLNMDGGLLLLPVACGRKRKWHLWKTEIFSNNADARAGANRGWGSFVKFNAVAVGVGDGDNLFSRDCRHCKWHREKLQPPTRLS